MKMRKIYRAILALALAFTLTAPSFAAEGEPAPTPEEQAVVQTQETPEEADPEPPAWLLPSEDGGQAAEPAELPSIPEEPDEEGQPGTSEEPPENPEVPETPSDLETPSTPEVPETPEDPVTPPAAEDPALPPAWLLPPEQVPAQTPDQVPPAVQTPVEAPIQAPQAEAPVISVAVPNTGSAIINPYGLPVMIDGQETREQVAGSTMLLENYSNVAVDVSANAVGTALSGVVFAVQPPAENTPEKAVFLYAEFQATEAYGLTVPWQGFFNDAPNQLSVMDTNSIKDNLVRLEAAGAPYSCGAVRLFGSVSAYPDQPWEAGDGFQVNLAFTFTPVIQEPQAIEGPGAEVNSTLVLPPEQALPDWIIPAGSVVEPAPAVPTDPVITPEPIVTPETIIPPEPSTVPEPAVPPEPVPETVPDETTVPVPADP